MDVFTSDQDRDLYLELVRKHAAQSGLEVLSWCLMTNHVHFVAIPAREDSLARGIGEAHRLYTRAVNSRQEVRGHLFQERFFSCPLDERHFVAAVRYVERNPVRAGLAEQAWEYPWSSARFHVGRRSRDRLVSERRPFGLDLDWRSLLALDPKESETLRSMTKVGRPKVGRPLGDQKFMDAAERLTGRVLHRLPPGRKPPKGE
jgi:putative transposase